MQETRHVSLDYRIKLIRVAPHSTHSCNAIQLAVCVFLGRMTQATKSNQARLRPDAHYTAIHVPVKTPVT
jgi:hypothetical protein